MSLHTQDSVLYALFMFGPDVWYEHSGALDAAMFDGWRRDMFATIRRKRLAGDAVDLITVVEGMDPVYAAQVDSGIYSRVHISKPLIGSYVKDLRLAHMASRARDIGAALAESGDAEAARAALLSLDSGVDSATVDGEKANALFIENLHHRAETGETGLSTGLIDLDRILCGLDPSDLCIVAARPSMGKTAFMLNVSACAPCPVGIFSLEMSTEQLMCRLIAAHGIDYGKLRSPRQLTDADWPHITEATVAVRKGLYINDQGGISIGALESEAYRMVTAHGVGLLCVDYLQLVTCKAERRLEEVSEVSRRLKALAKNLRVPVLVLCQMNRAIDGRPKPVPRLADLRESGQIEQDADQIIFIDRPEVHAEGYRPGEADFIVAKNRSGPTDKVKVLWQGQYQRFVNLERDHYPRSVA